MTFDKWQIRIFMIFTSFISVLGLNFGFICHVFSPMQSDMAMIYQMQMIFLNEKQIYYICSKKITKNSLNYIIIYFMKLDYIIMGVSVEVMISLYVTGVT